MDILILCLIVLMGWAAWIAFRPSSRRRTINANLHQHDGSLQKRDTLRDEPAELITIPEPNNRLLSADDERHAFKTGQPIWIRYKDTSGTVTERVVEIYRPRDDEVIYTWCRRSKPRAPSCVETFTNGVCCPSASTLIRSSPNTGMRKGLAIGQKKPHGTAGCGANRRRSQTVTNINR